MCVMCQYKTSPKFPQNGGVGQSKGGYILGEGCSLSSMMVTQASKMPYHFQILTALQSPTWFLPFGFLRPQVHFGGWREGDNYKEKKRN